ncbi:MAG: ABC transporter substrate-binding protein, partial [Chloroflexi bacterium]|nr:ABC transporter substrate-binding protein [Chloroflexota bacterium]
ISEWMRELGIPVESELTGFNTILNPVFVDADFDMYILGWSLTIYPDHVCDFFASWNDTATTGNYNTPGFNDPDYDALCTEFLAETDIQKAIVMNKELQAVLAEKLPYIPLFNRQSIDMINSRVQLPYTDVLGGIADQEGMQADAQVVSK